MAPGGGGVSDLGVVSGAGPASPESPAAALALFAIISIMAFLGSTGTGLGGTGGVSLCVSLSEGEVSALSALAVLPFMLALVMF